MNVFVVTSDNYFYLGVKEGLANKDLSVKKVTPSDLSVEQLKISKLNDVFVFYKPENSVELSLLLMTEAFSGGGIFIQERKKASFTYNIGRYAVLSFNADINALYSTIISNRYQERESIDLSSLLTKREKSILRFTIKGMNASSIGHFLGISKKTVYAHRRNAFVKLGGRNIFEVWPVKERLLDL